MLCKQRRERKKDQVILNVKKSSDKEKYKNDIIAEFYKTGIILNKIKGILFRHGIPYEAQLDEDLNQIVFEELCKKTPDEIIEMYEDDPSRLVGICTTITLRKGVSENGSNSPKINFTKSVLFLSRLNQSNTQYAEDAALNFLIDDDTEEDECKTNFYNLDVFFNELSNEAKETLSAIRDYQQSLEKTNSRFSIDKYYRKRTTNKKKVGTLLIETNFILNKQIKNKIMDKQTLLIEIEKVLPAINEYHRTRKVGHLTTDNIIDIKNIWDTYINPANKLTTSCTGCIKDAMDILESFYSANKPKEEESTKLTFEGVVETKPESSLEEVKANSIKEKTVSKPAVKKVNGRQKTK